jgi:alpha-tubulin suppressor-like RCC1 family protein
VRRLILTWVLVVALVSAPSIAFTPAIARSAGSSLLALSGSHVCVAEASDVACWGTNFLGQIEGPPSEGTKKVRRRFEAPVDSLSVFYSRTCVAVSGQVRCWGESSEEIFGRAGAESWEDVTAISGIDEYVTGVALSLVHACAVTRERHVWCWGKNQFLEVGSREKSFFATPVRSPLEGIEQVVTGTAGSCALGGGKVVCWGTNFSARFGEADPLARPFREVEGLVDPISIDMGDGHVCALTRSAKVMCWGDNNLGHFRPRAEDFVYRAETVVGFGSTVKQVALGSRYSCVLGINGRVTCLGLVPLTARRESRTVLATKLRFQTVSAGVDGTCGVTAERAVYCWGFVGTEDGFQKPTLLLNAPT